LGLALGEDVCDNGFFSEKQMSGGKYPDLKSRRFRYVDLYPDNVKSVKLQFRVTVIRRFNTANIEILLANMSHIATHFAGSDALSSSATTPESTMGPFYRA